MRGFLLLCGLVSVQAFSGVTESTRERVFVREDKKVGTETKPELTELSTAQINSAQKVSEVTLSLPKDSRGRANASNIRFLVDNDTGAITHACVGNKCYRPQGNKWVADQSYNSARAELDRAELRSGLVGGNKLSNLPVSELLIRLTEEKSAPVNTANRQTLLEFLPLQRRAPLRERVEQLEKQAEMNAEASHKANTQAVLEGIQAKSLVRKLEKERDLLVEQVKELRAKLSRQQIEMAGCASPVHGASESDTASSHSASKNRRRRAE